MWEEFVVNMFLGLIHAAIKNPAKAEALKEILLSVRDDINGLYPGS